MKSRDILSAMIFFLFPVVAFKNGKEISRFTGVIDEDRIETILDQLNR
jgi:thioredoxin-like negative regulator of GroEL